MVIFFFLPKFDRCKGFWVKLPSEVRIIRKIKFILTESNLRTVVTALVLSRLDYCNSLYLNALKQHTNRLQLVQNAAARLITATSKCVSVKEDLKKLH